MRFLHTSDWHLGRIFHGLHLLEDQMAVLGELMSIIREEKIDALFIAGDIYDRSVPPTEAVRALDEILVQLILGEKIPTVIIAGNHDNPDRLNFGVGKPLYHRACKCQAKTGHPFRQNRSHLRGPASLLRAPYGNGAFGG